MSSTGGGIVAHNSQGVFARKGKSLTLVNNTSEDLSFDEVTLCEWIKHFCGSDATATITLDK